MPDRITVMELWLDRRKLDALENELNEQGTNTEERMKELFQELYQNTVPLPVQAEIEKEEQEEAARMAAVAADRVKMTAYRVTRDGQQSCLRTDIGSDILVTTFQLSRYRNAPSTMDFEELLTDRTPVTRQEFDRLAMLRLEGSEKVTGVYDIDFDRDEFSYIDPQEGWRTFPMASVYYAVQRTEQKQGLSHEQMREVLLKNLEAWAVPSPGHFPMRAITFEGEIGVQADLLVFQVDPESWFDSLDAVFGTNTHTAENNDYLTVRAHYDTVKGEVCGVLEVIVNRDDGPFMMPEYVLNCVEKECLRKKMDGYCQQMTGMELTAYGAGIRESQEPEPEQEDHGIGPMMMG